jgi:hypothetical protein
VLLRVVLWIVLLLLAASTLRLGHAEGANPQVRPFNFSLSDLGFRTLPSGFRCCRSLSPFLLLHELLHGRNTTG